MSFSSVSLLGSALFRFPTENGCQKQPAFRRQQCAECRVEMAFGPKSTFDLSGSIRP